MKRLCAAQRQTLCDTLKQYDAEWINAGLAVLLRLPNGAPDEQIVRELMATSCRRVFEIVDRYR